MLWGVLGAGFYICCGACWELDFIFVVGRAGGWILYLL